MVSDEGAVVVGPGPTEQDVLSGRCARQSTQFDNPVPRRTLLPHRADSGMPRSSRFGRLTARVGGMDHVIGDSRLEGVVRHRTPPKSATGSVGGWHHRPTESPTPFSAPAHPLLIHIINFLP